MSPPPEQGQNAELYPPLSVTENAVCGETYPTPNENALLAVLPGITMCQIHPRYGPGSLLARGDFVMWDPVPGADSLGATLIVQVGGMRCYMTAADTAVAISKRDIMLMLPQDVIGLNFPFDVPAELTELLSARCGFRAEHSAGALDPAAFSEQARPFAVHAARVDEEQLAEDEPAQPAMGSKSKSMDPETARRRAYIEQERSAAKVLKMTAWLSAKIVDTSDNVAHRIEEYGERKTSAAQPTGKDVSHGLVRASSTSRVLARKASRASKKLANLVSDKAGSKVVHKFEVKEDDSARKKRARLIAAAALEGYSDVTDALADGYQAVLSSTQVQSREYASKKYGPNAALTMENTVATTFYAGNTALNTRRVVSVTHHLSKSAKVAAKHAGRYFIRGMKT